MDELSQYVARQLSGCFPDRSIAAHSIAAHVAAAMERVEYCFSRVVIKGFAPGGDPSFNHLHTDQYAMFLYLLSNSVFRTGGDPSLAAKAYGLNKALHGIDAFYEVELPPVFFFQHPVGTVLGRAVYGNYFAVYQRCSIGSNLDGEAPVLGDGLVMFGGSGIIGRCRTGNNVCLSVDAIVMDADIPADSVVFGRPPAIVRRPSRRRVTERFFRVS